MAGGSSGDKQEQAGVIHLAREKGHDGTAVELSNASAPVVNLHSVDKQMMSTSQSGYICMMRAGCQLLSSWFPTVMLGGVFEAVRVYAAAATTDLLKFLISCVAKKCVEVLCDGSIPDL
jgi:hypothetical protein